MFSLPGEEMRCRWKGSKCGSGDLKREAVRVLLRTLGRMGACRAGGRALAACPPCDLAVGLPQCYVHFQDTAFRFKPEFILTSEKHS